MTTSENSSGEQAIESRGFVETLVGGLAGGAVGVLIGLPIANTFSVGGLEAIATALLIPRTVHPRPGPESPSNYGVGDDRWSRRS